MNIIFINITQHPPCHGDSPALHLLTQSTSVTDPPPPLQDRMLNTMVPGEGKDVEDVEILKHQYEGFDSEMNANASRVGVVNQLAKQLLQVEHPNSEEIVAKQSEVRRQDSAGRVSWAVPSGDIQSVLSSETLQMQIQSWSVTVHRERSVNDEVVCFLCWTQITFAVDALKNNHHRHSFIRLCYLAISRSSN